MKAAVHSHYGPPDVIEIQEVPKPHPKDSEVLIKIRAAAVNPIDWHGMRGSPYFMRLMGGLRRPKDSRLGYDLAGQVEAVGKNVIHFKPGDEVFGICKGAFADYVCASESASAMSALAVKPDNLSFEQAAAVPVAAFTALQGLRDKGRMQPGQKVLINGAAGGVGTFAVQIARSFGALVTAVCSTRNVEMVGSLGADRVIDYTHEDFTRSGQHYDLVFDCVGNHSLVAYCRSLSPNGGLIVATGPNGRWLSPLARFIQTLVLSSFVRRRLSPVMAKPTEKDLIVMRELMQTGKVTPVIDRCYRLSEIAEAMRYLEGGHARGKVVITMGAASTT